MYSLFQLQFRVRPQHLKPLFLLLVLAGQVLQGGLQDILIGLEACDHLLGPLVLPMQIVEGSLHRLEVIQDLISLVQNPLSLNLSDNLRVNN